MDSFLDLSVECAPPQEKHIVVVRLTTTYWHDHNGIYSKQTLRYLRRQCKGYNVMHEDCENVGADGVFTRIVNLNECKDGVYQVVTCNEFHTWETPNIIEDYDYKLIPYVEPTVRDSRKVS
jgi:hypothetical protein